MAGATSAWGDAFASLFRLASRCLAAAAAARPSAADVAHELESLLGSMLPHDPSTAEGGVAGDRHDAERGVAAAWLAQADGVAGAASLGDVDDGSVYLWMRPLSARRLFVFDFDETVLSIHSVGLRLTPAAAATRPLDGDVADLPFFRQLCCAQILLILSQTD